MKTLVVIPARGGSKGIPGKNIKPLASKPLLHWTIDCARAVAADADICLSTDDPAIILCAEQAGLKVPFIRPEVLATDAASTVDVLLHAIGFYRQNGVEYQRILLLQPTSPFRRPRHVKEALALDTPEVDMVVSVFETKANPYYVLFEEDASGMLRKSKTLPDGSLVIRRQDAPPVYEFNGAIYIIKVASLEKHRNVGQLPHIRKYVMSAETSLDLDTPIDWMIAEALAPQFLTP